MDTTSFSEIAALDEFKNLPKEEKLKATQKYWDEFAASDPANIDNALKLKEFATQYVEADDLVKDAASVEARMAKVDRDVYAFKMTMGEASLRGEITPEEYEAESTTFEEELKARQEQVNQSQKVYDDANRGVVTAAAKAALEAGVFGEQALRPALGMSFPGAPIPTTTDADVALRQRYDNARNILSEKFNLEPEEADDLVKHQLGLQKEPVSRDAFGVIHFKDDLLARSTSDIEAAVKESKLPERVKTATIAGLGDRVQNYKKNIVNEAAQYHKELAADIKLDPTGDPDKEYKKITDVLQETRLGQTGGGVMGYALERLGGAISTLAGATQRTPVPTGSMGDRGIEKTDVEKFQKTVLTPAKKQESINALSDRINQEKVRFLGTNAAVVGQGIGSAIESIAIGALTGGMGTALISADRIAKAGKFGQVALGFGQRALNTAPVAGYFGAGQALDTYESAVKAGKSPMEAAKLAATSGAVEFGVTTLFGGVKLGGLEDVRLRFANPEVRRQLAKTVARSWREFGFGAAKGMAGEISEELSITALDSVLVQAEINPNMTVEDFKKSLKDTLVATAISSGPLTTLSEVREQGMGLLRATQGEFTPVDVTPAERRADELLDSAEQAAPEAAAAARSVLDAQGQPISSAPPVLPPPAGFETTPPPDVARDQRDSAILSRVTPEEARLGGLPARVLGREEFSIQRPQRGLLGIRRDPETLGGRMDFFFESREAAQPLLDQLTRAGFSNGINNIGGGLVWVNAKDISGGTQNLENFLGLAKTPTVTPSISPTPPDVTALPTQEDLPEVPVAEGNVPPPSLEGVGEVAEAAPPVSVEGTPTVEAPVTPEAPAPLTPGQPVNVTLDDGTTAPGSFRGYDSSGNPQVSTLADPETVLTRRKAQVTPISPTPTPTTQPDATQERSIEESRQPERQDADEGGTPAETGGGDLTEPSREKQKEDEVTAETPAPVASRTLTAPIYGTADSKVVGYSWDGNGNVSFTVQDGLGNETQVSRGDLQNTLKPKTSTAKAALDKFALQARRNAGDLSRGKNQSFTDEDLDALGQEASTEADTPQTIINRETNELKRLNGLVNTLRQNAADATRKGNLVEAASLTDSYNSALAQLAERNAALTSFKQDNPTAPAPRMTPTQQGIYDKVRNNPSFPVINALLDMGSKIKRKAFNEKNPEYNGYIPIGGLRGLGYPNGRVAATELLRSIYSMDSRTGLSPDKALLDSGIASDESIAANTPDEMWGLLDEELKRVAEERTYDEENPDEVASVENIAKAENNAARASRQRENFDNALENGEVQLSLDALNEGDRISLNGVVVEVLEVYQDEFGAVTEILLGETEAFGSRLYKADPNEANPTIGIDQNGHVLKKDFESGNYPQEIKDFLDSQEADRVREEHHELMAEATRATNEEERNTSPISMANGETLGEPLEYNEENIAAFDAIQDELERTKFMARMMVSMLEKAREVKGTEEIDYTTPEDFNENEYFSLQEGIANPLLEQAGGVVPPPSPRRQFGLLYDAAMAAEVAWKTSKKEGTAGTRLLNSLIEGIDQVRVLRDIEIAHLTLEGVARRDAVNYRSQQLANLLNNPREGQAYKDELAKAEINLAEASAKYQEILMYAASARSQSGRSLNAWKFAIKDDYSYASVSARERTVRLAARRKVDPNATFKFSEEELAELRAYSESQLALQDLLKLKTDARTLSGKDRAAWVENESDFANTIRQLQETILRMEAEKAKGPRNVKGLKKAQESLKVKADLARQRRASKKGGTLSLPIFLIDQDTAEAIEDYAIIGADWFFNNALMTLGEFAARLKKEGSQLADTFVDRIYAGAKKNYNREIREFAAQEGRSSEDIIAELDADDTPTRGMVFDLARAFIREGLRDFEVLNAVTEAMSGPFPDLSREDVAILFTNYGKGESVAPTELQAALITAKNLERDTLKLESLQRGEPPLRSQNVVQKEITPKLLDLRTKIQNLQKKMKYDQRDESQELASAHSKSRNRMRNIIAAKRKAVKEGIALESNRMGDKGDLPAENLALQAELDQVNEEYNAAFGALTPDEMERRQKLSAHNTAERWIGSMTATASDTQKWDVKPEQELNLQKLITDHIRKANPEFQAQAAAFGVTDEQARVMDALANHERKSRETFKETKKKLRKEEVAEREAARRQPGAVADALINRFSEKMLDSSQLKRDSKPTSEVTLLTRSHLKEAIPDFVDVMVGLGATREQAEALDALINAEREKIASLKTISVTDRNAILEKSLDRQIQAEQDLINQGLVKAIKNGEKNPAETEAVLSRRKALKELRLLKYELYEAANPGQLATNQAFKDVNDAITRRQKTLAELESGLVTERKEKKDRTEGVNVTQELQDQWDTSDRLDVLITSLRREKAKLPDTPSQTARKIEASLKLAESALARNEKRIANNDILPREKTESPASKDARVKEVRGRNKELLNLILEMQREQQIGSFSPAARLARQLGTSQKILDELNEANRTGVYPKKKERPKPLDDRDLDMIRFKIDRARELRDANLAQQLWNETKGMKRRKEQLIALLRFRQMFSLTGDVGNPSRQLGFARFKFLKNDILKLITAAWNPATRQDIRDNGLIIQRWLTAIAQAAKSDEAEFESYSKFLNHPDYMRRAKLGFQLLRPGEFSAELGKGDTARLNPMNLFPWWAIGVAATIKATLRASIQAMSPTSNVSIFDFASTVAVGFGALKAAKVLERMNRVALNVGRWEVQNLMDQKSLAENYFGWDRHEEYEKDMIRVTNTFSGRGTLEGDNIGPAFEGAVNLLSVVSDHPRWRLSRIMVAFGQPLFQLKFGGPKEKRAAAYKVAENYFDMFAGTALNMYLTYLIFGLTPMTSFIVGLVSGKGDEDDEEENRKKRERIEKLTYPVSHYLDPKFGAMRVGDVYFDDLSGATKYLSFLMRVLSDTKLDPAAREQGIDREIPIEAYDKRKMISDFLAGHLNRNAQFGIEALVMGEYRTGGPVGDLPLGTAVLATMDAFTVNATLRDMGKIYDKLGDVDGTIAIAQLLGGIGVSPAETGRERDIRIAKERRLAAEEARRRRQAE